MSVDSAEPQPANPFKTMVDTIVAPNDAFEALRTRPTWGWAFVLTLVLTAIGFYLMLPISRHAFVAGSAAMIAKSPQLAQMSPAGQQAWLHGSLSFMPYFVIFYLIVIPIVLLLQTVLMLIFNAIGRGSAGFGTLWSAAVNISVPTVGIAAIVTAFIALLRGPESFDSMQALQQVLPTLALLAPGAGVKTTAFLTAFTPFSIYGAILIGYAMVMVARVPKVQAWLTGILAIVLPALFAMAFAR